MPAAVSQTHSFLHHGNRAVMVPNFPGLTAANHGINGTTCWMTNYPRDEFEYVEVDEAGARWFLRTALYEMGRLTEAARRDYEWELAEREAGRAQVAA